MDRRLSSLAGRPLRAASRLPIGAVADGFFQVGTLVEAGVLKPIRPDKLARMAMLYARWGASPALGSATSAIHYPDEPAIVDELGTLTFAETHERSNALARALRSEGIEPGDGVAIMCRNHRHFVEATMACSKLGLIALYLNTAFAAPQLKEVLDRESPAALIYDQEFAEMLEGGAGAVRRFIAWEEADPPDTTLDQLIRSSPSSDLDPPEENGRFVILTSGTTGSPKGAQRDSRTGSGRSRPCSRRCRCARARRS